MRFGGDTKRRTFVISDVHGYPEFITNALEHGRFRSGVDRLVFAGDFLDRGPDPGGCLALVERYATHVLFGNHELAVILGHRISGQDAGSFVFREVLLARLSPSRGDAVAAGDPASANTPWGAVVCVDGVLVSHAGVSDHYQRMFLDECSGRPEVLAERLEADFRGACERELEAGRNQEESILGDHGPLWFRPKPFSRWRPLPGVVQVAGHTPPLRVPAVPGFHMIDPCAFFGVRDGGSYRYALVEDGAVRVEDGSLLRSGGRLQR